MSFVVFIFFVSFFMVVFYLVHYIFLLLLLELVLLSIFVFMAFFFFGVNGLGSFFVFILLMVCMGGFSISLLVSFSRLKGRDFWYSFFPL